MDMVCYLVKILLFLVSKIFQDSPIDAVLEANIPHVSPKWGPLTSVDIYGLNVLIVSKNFVP